MSQITANNFKNRCSSRPCKKCYEDHSKIVLYPILDESPMQWRHNAYVNRGNIFQDMENGNASEARLMHIVNTGRRIEPYIKLERDYAAYIGLHKLTPRSKFNEEREKIKVSMSRWWNIKLFGKRVKTYCDEKGMTAKDFFRHLARVEYKRSLGNYIDHVEGCKYKKGNQAWLYIHAAELVDVIRNIA